MRLDGTDDVEVPATRSCGDLDPVWSPNDEWIAFAGDYQIHVIRPDGSGLRRFAHANWRDSDPAWSPDSRRIAFHAERGDAVHLFVVNLDGRNRVDLTRKLGFRGWDVSWAPDGRRLVFACERRSRPNLCIGNLRTGTVRLVSKRRLPAFGPEWQPGAR